MISEEILVIVVSTLFGLITYLLITMQFRFREMEKERKILIREINDVIEYEIRNVNIRLENIQKGLISEEFLVRK